MNWRGRAEFFSVAAALMRRILVDHARARRADKRGGESERLVFDEALDMPDEAGVDIDLLDLDGFCRIEGDHARIDAQHPGALAGHGHLGASERVGEAVLRQALDLPLAVIALRALDLQRLPGQHVPQRVKLGADGVIKGGPSSFRSLFRGRRLAAGAGGQRASRGKKKTSAVGRERV